MDCSLSKRKYLIMYDIARTNRRLTAVCNNERPLIQIQSNLYVLSFYCNIVYN